jgi:hypothetical protein
LFAGAPAVVVGVACGQHHAAEARRFGAAVIPELRALGLA